MDIPYNDLFKDQSMRLLLQNGRRGIISKLYLQSWTADVIVIGSTETILRQVPLSSNISASNIQEGDKCKLDIFDNSNSRDMVVAYVYGRRPLV